MRGVPLCPIALTATFTAFYSVFCRYNCPAAINFSRPGGQLENALQHTVVKDKRTNVFIGIL